MTGTFRIALSGAAAMAVAAGIWIAVARVGAGTAASPHGSATPVREVVTNKNLNPFGAPTGNGDFKVPPPPEEPTLVPTIGTKTTQRIYGTTPFDEAVSVTQHVWPAVVPLNDPTENNNVPDRPWGLTLLTPDDPLTAITAVPLLHFPDDAPILYVTKNGIPKVTMNEIKRLGDTGISRFNNVDAFLVGAAANPVVESQLKAAGLKYVEVTAPNVPELANKVDQLYGSIENPDTGVADMGNGVQNVMVGSMDGTDYRYLLPATHWVAHMPTGLLWVTKNSVPQPTIDALKRRKGRARIYIFGGPDQVSGTVARQLAQYGPIIRISNDDPVDFNKPPTDNPIDTAIAFAKMWDPEGMVGWKITGPGHGFTLVYIDDWQAAVASAPFSHLGFHAPLLFTDSVTKLPAQDKGYYELVAPTFLTSPADGPYNMTYVIGDWSKISWSQQARVDYLSEMTNRRVWRQDTGSRYTDSSQ